MTTVNMERVMTPCRFVTVDDPTWIRLDPNSQSISIHHAYVHVGIQNPNSGLEIQIPLTTYVHVVCTIPSTNNAHPVEVAPEIARRQY